MGIKLCKNCKWYKASDYSQCGSKKNISGVDYIGLGQNVLFYSALNLREKEQYCGPDANWFEHKEAA